MNDQKNKIEVVGYDPKWPEQFAAEAKLIEKALGSNCRAVHHIGSTSIPDLSAKPIIDILVVVRNIQAVDRANEAMEALDYEVKGEYGIAFRRYFQKGKRNRTHHVHVFQEEDPEISRYLKFRDWMREHPEDAKNYAILKIELAQKFPFEMLQYCNGKESFVKNIDSRNGFEGYRVVQALTDQEWATVNKLRPQEPLEEGEDHRHLVFYKNSEVVGYACLQLKNQSEALLKMLIMDENFHALESQFLKLCERWLNHQGFQTLLSDQIKFLRLSPQDRPRIAVYIATSLDGYIARQDGNLDWLMDGHTGDEDYGFKEFIRSIDTIVLGRKTYEVVSAFAEWPYKEKRVVVLSHQLKSVLPEAELFSGNLSDLLTMLHSEGVKKIWVDGGITASKFVEEGLVDELTLSILPRILGKGIPLFSNMQREHKYRLVSTTSYESGLAQLKYVDEFTN